MADLGEGAGGEGALVDEERGLAAVTGEPAGSGRLADPDDRPTTRTMEGAQAPGRWSIEALPASCASAVMLNPSTMRIKVVAAGCQT